MCQGQHALSESWDLIFYVIAGKPPSAFPQDRLHIDFSQEVSIGRQLAGVVDGLLEPLVEDRLTAGEALDMLTPDAEQNASPSNR